MLNVLLGLRFARSLVCHCCVSKSVSLDNQPCQARSLDIDINSNEALYYSFTVSVNKCGGRCNSTDDGYAWICVPNKVKKLIYKLII